VRLYVKPKTKAHNSAAELLRLYGIETVLQTDEQGSYFDATPPEYWSEKRKQVFQSAIELRGELKL
jgi:hypothetical protein